MLSKRKNTVIKAAHEQTHDVSAPLRTHSPDASMLWDLPHCHAPLQLLLGASTAELQILAPGLCGYTASF